jgi:hypothetical protein
MSLSEHLCVPLGLIISDANRDFVLPSSSLEEEDRETVTVAVAPETIMDSLYDNMCIRKKKTTRLTVKKKKSGSNSPRSGLRHTR